MEYKIITIVLFYCCCLITVAAQKVLTVNQPHAIKDEADLGSPSVLSAETEQERSTAADTQDQDGERAGTLPDIRIRSSPVQQNADGPGSEITYTKNPG